MVVVFAQAAPEPESESVPGSRVRLLVSSEGYQDSRCKAAYIYRTDCTAHSNTTVCNRAIL